MAEEDELLNLPSFVACQVRCRTAREEYMEAEEAVTVDEDENTVTVTSYTPATSSEYGGSKSMEGERERAFAVSEVWPGGCCES